MNGNVLIVEDEEAIINVLSSILIANEYIPVVAKNGGQALTMLRSFQPDVVLLDLGLPDMDGIDILKKVKEVHPCPVLVVSARDKEWEKVEALDLGADDYITKPFLPLELVARVKAQLRRYKRYNTGPEADEDVLVHAGLVMNVKTHACTLNEKPLSLTPTEFSILRILCQQKGKVVSAEELFHQIWGDEYFSKNNNTITVHIRHLREKLGDSSENPKYIKTVWGCGYKIEN